VIRGSRRLTAKAPIEALTTGEKAMTNNTNDDFEDLYKDLPADEREYMQRYHKPDGVCFHCGQPANQHHPVGPITITVSDPDGDESTHEFCNWECLGHWAAECAGGVLVIDRS
jgi:hypothetical protein